MSVTALQLITTAFQTLGVYAPGDAIADADAQDGFRRLNAMMGSWALQPLTIPVIAREVFDLVSGQGSPTNPYTIGPGGDFDTSRPLQLEGAGLVLGNSSPAIELPRGMLTDDAYEAIQVKTLTNALFTDVYYNATFDDGFGRIYLWPVPDSADNDLVLYRLQQLSAFVSLTAAYDLPNGYEEAMSYNLARRLAMPYGKPLNPDLLDLATQSLATIKRANTKLTDIPQDPAFTHDRRGGYNIQTGTGG